MFPTLTIGPMALPVASLAIIIGLWVGLTFAERHALRYKVASETIYNLALVSFISGVVGARLLYIVRYPEAFFTNLANLISLNPGLLDPIGGLVIGLLAAIVYAQRNQLALWPTLDTLTSGFSFVAIALGVAHLANGDSFGAPTQVLWAIPLWGADRHPTQIYEIQFAIVILWLTWPRKTLLPTGLRFLLFTALTAAASQFLEAFRGDSVVLANGIRIAQVAAWLVLAASLLLMRRRASAGKQETVEQ